MDPIFAKLHGNNKTLHWALLDITRTNIWNATAARNVGDTPEILPGALIRTSSGGGPNTGAIAGGVAGGIIVMAAVAGLVFAFWRRRRRVQKPSATTVVEDAQPPSALQLGQVHSVPSYGHTQVPHWQAMLNGANNMTTYPQQQEGVLTSTPNGNNLDNMQPLRMPVQGYHGLPTV
ncbi:hypothetical protein H4582DRAFT_2057524 [Lactarius indigo]|nr:hypothetical protein H4582DRAFT_2057524 [Lactarius indigo]